MDNAEGLAPAAVAVAIEGLGIPTPRRSVEGSPGSRDFIMGGQPEWPVEVQSSSYQHYSSYQH
jgi:hypothetical protein